MSDKIKPVEPEHIACDVCLKEIPEDAAKTFEGDEYLLHFCGLECLTKWKKAHPPKPNNK
ncbi:MAG: hypothetical protein A2V90_05655 [Gammaproteobacteria bacterium RBG_16_57_12]|nr:MAG: hypothetical protein A2V90_05655 [Gammaproteobacteria bacterium RBG_16_57_12]